MSLRDFFGIPDRGLFAAAPNARRPRRPRIGRGWDASDTGRLFADWQVSFASPDEEVRLRQTVERGRSRTLERTNPYATRYYWLLLANVFGERGIRLIPRVMDTVAGKQVPDREANLNLREGWERWGKKGECTVDGRHSWGKVLQLLGVSLKRDGEAFLRLYRGSDFGRFGFRVQPLEADHCPTSLNRTYEGRLIKMGIERDRFDRPLAYWMSPLHPGDSIVRQVTTTAQYIRVPVDEVLHVYDPRRIAQSRGLPALESGMPALHMLGGYEEAELVAARAAASKMGWIQSETGGEYTGDEEGTELEETEIQETLEPGTVGQLPKGMEFVGFDPTHPTTAFGPFVKQQLRRWAAAAGVSYNSIASDLEGVNFSSLREGRLSERDLWKLDQGRIVEDVCDPTYDAWLPQALLSGELGLSPNRIDRYRAHRWQARRWEWIDPQKEAQADELSLDNLTSSLSSIIENRGREVREVFEEIRAEIDLAEEYGIADLLPYMQPRRNGGAPQSAFPADEEPEGEEPDGEPTAGGTNE